MRLKILVISATIALLISIPGWYLINAEKREEPLKPKYAWKPVQARLTHYSPKEKAEQRWKGKTSLNKSAHNESGVAVDPNFIPYGSMVYIPDIGIRIADDTGGKCKQYGKDGKILIDVRWMDKTHRELRKMGATYQTVYILEKVN